MSRKSTITNSDTITLSPEFEQLLKSRYGLVKQNDILTTISVSQSSIPSVSKVKSKIVNPTSAIHEVQPHMPVQPIPKEYIDKARDYFHNTHSRYSANNLRNYAYFVLSINVARRAGDILNLKIKNVLDADGTLKDHLIIGHEEKTNKRATILLNSKAKEALTEYLNSKESLDMEDYLFQNYKTGEKLSVDGARYVMKEMAKAIGLDINIGTHSCRKTFGTEAINNNPNNSTVEIELSELYNHANVKTSRRYMGLTQNRMDQFVESNAL